MLLGRLESLMAAICLSSFFWHKRSYFANSNENYINKFKTLGFLFSFFFWSLEKVTLWLILVFDAIKLSLIDIWAWLAAMKTDPLEQGFLIRQPSLFMSTTGACLHVGQDQFKLIPHHKSNHVLSAQRKTKIHYATDR